MIEPKSTSYDITLNLKTEKCYFEKESHVKNHSSAKNEEVEDQDTNSSPQSKKKKPQHKSKHEGSDNEEPEEEVKAHNHHSKEASEKKKKSEKKSEEEKLPEPTLLSLGKIIAILLDDTIIRSILEKVLNNKGVGPSDVEIYKIMQKDMQSMLADSIESLGGDVKKLWEAYLEAFNSILSMDLKKFPKYFSGGSAKEVEQIVILLGKTIKLCST